MCVFRPIYLINCNYMSASRCLGLLLLCISAALLNSCEEEVRPEPVLEPISIVEPKFSNITACLSSTEREGVTAFPGEEIPINLRLTTDRIIDTLRGGFHVDSDNSGYEIGFDNSIPFLKVGYSSDSNNIQIYQGSFVIPDSAASSCDVVRLHFTMEAGLGTIDPLVFDKIIRIDIR